MRTSFTLIELLVVVAIIAVLVAILLPALSTAREQARSVDCGMGMRHIGVAIHGYANDHHGFMPGPTPGFQAVPADPKNPHPDILVYYLCGLLRTYLGGLEISSETFTCPSIKMSNPNLNGFYYARHTTSPGLQRSPWGYPGAPIDYPDKIDRLAPTLGILTELDAISWPYVNPEPLPPEPVHSSTARNYLHADMHVESIHLDMLPSWGWPD